MAVEVYTATLSNADESDVSLDLYDGDGAQIGTVTVSRDVWDELDSGVDTFVISGIDDIDTDEE